MGKLDYYKVLGISKNSEEREIKKAYKRLAIKYHPDRNPGNMRAEEKFKEIKEAYEILIDPKKRSAYDRYGHSFFEQGNVDFNGFKEGVNTDFGDIFGDVFGDIFGSGRSNKSNRGEDLCCDIDLSLEESIKGTTRKIRIPTLIKCKTCSGSGARPGTASDFCSTCNGTGQIQMRQGFFSVQQTCPTCYGERRIIKNPCYRCNGNGTVKESKILSVKIPIGINSGDRIRLSGEGKVGKYGSTPGDLYVRVNIRKHDLFERKENNLYCEIPITFSLAALGGEIEIPTLYGKVKLKIPSETQTGKLFRMKGKGIKSVSGYSRGDLLCRVVVETPTSLNEHQKSLLTELEKSINVKDNRNIPKSNNFFRSVKRFFDILSSN